MWSLSWSNLINLTIFITPINLWWFLMKIISLDLLPLLFERCLLFHIQIHTFFFWCILHLCNPRNIVHLIVLSELEIIDQVSILSLFCCLWWTCLQRVRVLACVQSACVWLAVQWWVLYCWYVYWVMGLSTFDVVVWFWSTICAILFEIILCGLLQTLPDLFTSHLPIKSLHFFFSH